MTAAMVYNEDDHIDDDDNDDDDGRDDDDYDDEQAHTCCPYLYMHNVYYNIYTMTVYSHWLRCDLP